VRTWTPPRQRRARGEELAGGGADAGGSEGAGAAGAGEAHRPRPGSFTSELEVPAGRTLRLRIEDADGLGEHDLRGSQREP